MRIGNAWSKNADDGSTYISVALDETVIALCPELKNVNISLSYVKQTDRKSEKSPDWTISMTARKPKEETEA